MISSIIINTCEYLFPVSMNVPVTDGLDDVPSPCSLDDGITHPTFGLGNVNSTEWISTLRGGNTTIGLCVF